MDLRSTTPSLTKSYFRPAFSKPSHRPPIPICSLLFRHVSRDGLVCLSFARHANELPQGGVNNFGIVTHVTLKTFPQPQVWVSKDVFFLPSQSQRSAQGGTVIVQGDLTKAIDVTAHYANVTTDPRASMAAVYLSVNGSVSLYSIVSFVTSNGGPRHKRPSVSTSHRFSVLRHIPYAIFYSSRLLGWSYTSAR